MHLAIYKARPDVKAVVHSHPPHATAFAIASVELPTCIHPEAEVFLGAVKTAKYVTPGDTRLGESILPYVKDSNTILLQNHGTVTFDKDLENAYYKLEIVDAYARILLLAKQIGSIRPLDAGGDEGTAGAEGAVRPRRAAARRTAVEDLSCSTDFLSRVGGDVATKRPHAERRRRPCRPRRQARRPGVVRPRAGGRRRWRPSKYSEADVETLVQTITDQIMAAVVKFDGVPVMRAGESRSGLQRDQCRNHMKVTIIGGGGRVGSNAAFALQCAASSARSISSTPTSRWPRAKRSICSTAPASPATRRSTPAATRSAPTPT